MSSESIDPMAEIEAMKNVSSALNQLDEAARSRVLRWAFDIFNVNINVQRTSKTQASIENDTQNEADNHQDSYDDIADLYSRSNASNDPEKALIVGYWVQVIEKQQDFDSQRINKELKHLGHGVTNITSALSSLIGRKPALVIQTRKSGNSQQARKKYKLTHEGIKRVKEMLQGVIQ